MINKLKSMIDTGEGHITKIEMLTIIFIASCTIGIMYLSFNHSDIGISEAKIRILHLGIMTAIGIFFFLFGDWMVRKWKDGRIKARNS